MSPKKNPLEMEGLREKKVEMVVHLHPSRASNVHQGVGRDSEFSPHEALYSPQTNIFLEASSVTESLNPKPCRYNEHFEGPVLAHSDTKIQGRTAAILEGLTPYFCVGLTIMLLLFSPKVGLFVAGKVNKVEEDFLGVVVLGFFNAAIGFSGIRNGLAYCEGIDGTKVWMNEDDERHIIKTGSLIRFSVKSVQENEEILDLTGALLGPRTGYVKWLALQSEERDKIKNTHRSSENGVKKSNNYKGNMIVEVKAEVFEGTGEHTPKKKKKRKDENDTGARTGGDSSVKKRRKSLDVSAL